MVCRPDAVPAENREEGAVHAVRPGVPGDVTPPPVARGAAVSADAGIEVVLTGVRMPGMNAIMERWVQTCRRELRQRLGGTQRVRACRSTCTDEVFGKHNPAVPDHRRSGRPTTGSCTAKETAWLRLRTS